MTYEFQCEEPDCRAVIETYNYRHDTLPNMIACPYCEGTAFYKPSAPAVLTQNMGNKPFDVAVGRDAEMRWSVIREQQAKRDKVRQEANQTGLEATAFNEFKPISDELKRRRTEGMKAVEREGYKADELKSMNKATSQP